MAARVGGISEQQLRNVCEMIPEDKIEEFGRALGFSTQGLCTVLGDLPAQTGCDGRLLMILNWRQKTPPSRQYPDMIQALEETKLQHLAGVLEREDEAAPPIRDIRVRGNNNNVCQ